MQLPPFLDMRESTLRKYPVDATGFDLDGDLSASIDRVKMSRPVITIIHRDDDTKEAA